MWGGMVVSLTRGDTLYAYNAGEPMLPASTMKLLTSSIAFETFGPNYQFSTDALRDGAVGPDGTLTGNLYIRGDGVPKNCDQARLLLTAVAKRGVNEAATKLRTLDSNGCS